VEKNNNSKDSRKKTTKKKRQDKKPLLAGQQGVVRADLNVRTTLRSLQNLLNLEIRKKKEVGKEIGNFFGFN